LLRDLLGERAEKKSKSYNFVTTCAATFTPFFLSAASVYDRWISIEAGLPGNNN
jgi:hypothetical protein